MRPPSCPSCGSKKAGTVSIKWEGGRDDDEFLLTLKCRACNHTAILDSQTREEHASMKKTRRRAGLIARTNRLRARRSR